MFIFSKGIAFFKNKTSYKGCKLNYNSVLHTIYKFIITSKYLGYNFKMNNYIIA